jgi:hypothetical protein
LIAGFFLKRQKFVQKLLIHPPTFKSSMASAIVEAQSKAVLLISAEIG